MSEDDELLSDLPDEEIAPAAPALPWLRRLDAVRAHLDALAVAGALPGLTDPDPGGSERWDSGQVWAHLAEFPAYWIGEVRHLLASPDTGDAVPFGRTKRDSGRVAAIARDRGRAVAELADQALLGCAALEVLVRAMDAADWARSGRHETLGVMGMDRIMEEFLVGHLEQHAGQLDGLVGVRG